jgi:hypothetical protein
MADFWKTKEFRSLISRDRNLNVPSTPNNNPSIKVGNEVNPANEKQDYSDVPIEIERIRHIAEEKVADETATLPSNLADILRVQAQKIYDTLPKDSAGQVPNILGSVSLGDRLYFNPEDRTITNVSDKAYPLYYDGSGNMSVIGEADQVPEGYTATFFDRKTATNLMSWYAMYPSMVAETKQEQDRIEQLRQTKLEVSDLTNAIKTGTATDTTTYWINKDGETIPYSARKWKWWESLLSPLQEMDYKQKEMIGGQLNESTMSSTTPARLPISPDANRSLIKELGRRAIDENAGATIARIWGLVRGGLGAVVESIWNLGVGGQQLLTKSEMLQSAILAGNEEKTQEIMDSISKIEMNGTPEQEEAYTTMSDFIKVAANALNGQPMIQISDNAVDKSDAEKYVIATDLQNKGIQFFAQSSMTEDPKTATSLFDDAIQSMVDSYKIQSTIGQLDPFFSYTWISQPELREQFYHAMAYVQLQKGGTPLTKAEVRQLKWRFEHGTIEFVGECFSDASNLIFDAPIGSAINHFADGTAFWKELTKIIPAGQLEDMTLFPLLYRTAVGTVATDLKYVMKIAEESTNPAVQLFVDAGAKIGAIFRKTYKRQATELGIDVVNNLFRKLFVADATVDLNELQVISDLGEDVSRLMNGGTSSADEILEALRKTGNYPEQLMTSRTVDTVMKMVETADPLDLKGDTWSELLSSARQAIIKNAKENMLTVAQYDLLKTIRQDGIDDVDIINTMLEDTIKKIDGTEIPVRYSDLGTAYGGIFSETLRKQHSEYWGQMPFSGGRYRVFDDEYLKKMLGNLPGKTGNFFKSLYSVSAGMYEAWYNGWIRTILTSTFKFFGIYSPAENITLYHTTRGGSLLGSVFDMLDDSNDVARRLADLPAEARAGYDPLWSSASSRSSKTLNYIDVLGDKPTSWIATPTNIVDLMHKNALRKWSAWFQELPISTKANRAFKELSFLGTTILQYPAAGADIASMADLITKATIATGKMTANYGIVNPVVFKNVSESLTTKMLELNYDQKTIDNVLDTFSILWNEAGGNSRQFNKIIDKMDNFQLINLPSIDIAGIAVEEEQRVARLIRQDITGQINSVINRGEPITSDVLSGVISNIKQRYTDMANEALTETGLTASTLFGNTHTVRPVTYNTLQLLDQMEYTGTYPKNLDDIINNQTIEDILSENDIPIDTGKSVQELCSDLYYELRLGYPPEQVIDTSKLPHDTADSLFQFDPNNKIIVSPYTKSHPDDIQLLWDAKLAEEAKSPSQILWKTNYDSYYLPGRGELSGIQKNLTKQITDADLVGETVPLSTRELKASLDEFIITHDTFRQKRVESFLQNVYPRTTKGNHDAWDLYYSIMARYDEGAGKAMLDMSKAIQSNTDFARITYRDELRWLGFDVKTNEAGNISEVWFLDPGSGQRTLLGHTNAIYKFGYMGENPFLLYFKSHFGITNSSLLDATLDISDESLDALKQISPTPILKTDIDKVPTEQEMFFHSEINRKRFIDNGMTYRDFSEIILNNPEKSIDDMTPEEWIKAMRKVASGRDDAASKTINDVAEDIENRVNYYTGVYLLGNKRYSIPFSEDILPEQSRYWIANKIKETANHEAIQHALDDVEEQLIDLNNKGMLTTDNAAKDLLKTDLRSEVNKSIGTMSQMENAIWYGDEVTGITGLEGAIPYMEQRMRVGKETVIDRTMKKFVPFWMYSTRGSAIWVRIAAEHPEYLQLYARYQRLSTAKAFEKGAISSSGQPLASKVGKIPLIKINGTEVWASVDSAIPFFRYFLVPNESAMADYDEGMSNLQRFWAQVRGDMQIHGFGLNPWVDVALTAAFGQNDPYSTMTAGQKAAYYGLSSILPVDLLPPNWVAMINKVIPERLLKIDGSEVSWFDSLVETRILEDYIQKIHAEASEEKKYALVEEMDSMIQARESSDIYNGYVASVKQEDYYKTLSGWFTGVYPNLFTAGQAEIYSLRNHQNLLRDSINNEIGAQIFFMDLTPMQLYEKRTEERYLSPEGKLYDTRSLLSWVTDPTTGRTIRGEDRRKQTQIAFDQKAQTDEYWSRIQDATTKFESRMKLVPIGSEFKDQRAIQWRSEYFEELQSIEGSLEFDLVYRDWSAGLKPKELVYQHFENAWWRFINYTKPRWDYDGGEDYDDYQIRLTTWTNSFENLANEFAPLFTPQILSATQTAYADQDFSDVLSTLVSNTTPENYRAWELSKDTAIEAVYRYYDEAYLDPYYKGYYDQAGYANQQLFKDTYLTLHPKPTDDDILAGVMEMYGNQFTEDDIRNALKAETGESRGVLSAEEARTKGRTSTEELYDQIWLIRNIAGSKRSNELEQSLISLGYAADLDMMNSMYEMEGGVNAFPWNVNFSDPQRVSDFHDHLMEAADSIGLAEPSQSELVKMAEAEKLNEQFKQEMAVAVGENWENKVYPYFNMDYEEKKIYKSADPAGYEAVNTYSALRRQYERKYPIWAYYYTQKTSLSKSIIKSSQSTVDSTLTDIATKYGYDSSMIETLPSWAQRLSAAGQLSETVRAKIYAVMQGKSDMDTNLSSFLDLLMQLNPSYKKEIEDFIDQYL